jgi:hypothetical protein
MQELRASTQDKILWLKLHEPEDVGGFFHSFGVNQSRANKKKIQLLSQ